MTAATLLGLTVVLPPAAMRAATGARMIPGPPPQGAPPLCRANGAISTGMSTAAPGEGTHYAPASSRFCMVSQKAADDEYEQCYVRQQSPGWAPEHIAPGVGRSS